MNRREFIAVMGVTAAAAGKVMAEQSIESMPRIRRNGRIKQGLWVTTFGEDHFSYGKNFSFEEICQHASRLGAHGLDLILPENWPVMRQYGLKLLMAKEGPLTFEDGIIHPDVNEKNEGPVRDYIDFCSENDVRLFAGIGGEQRDMSLETAANNAVTFLNRIKDHLERKNVVLALEIMNTRRTTQGLGRPGQVFGHWDWGLDVVRRVNSSHVKLICDIYHLQIMDGDLASHISESIDWIAHFHVAGVPTRNEIDNNQEINYRYLAEVIASLDYQGYVSHEWRPSAGKDPLNAIETAMNIMDV